MRVALFVTCLNDALYPDTGKAVVTLLERLGVEVEFPLDQTCCGQMHFNTGYRAACEPLVRGFAETFAPYDAVVVPSASCAGMARHFHPQVVAGGNASWRVSDVATKVYELSEFLVDVLEVTDVGAYYPHRVTYHPTCHSLRVLGVGDRPLRLLRAVRGLDLVELPEAEQCCGFGGTFAVKNADVSVAMGADKVAHVHETGAEVLTAADNSCLMHLGGMLSRLRTGVRTVHLAEILAATEEEGAA
jgi:L-lactate dehydrogenase complex protein LldE